MNNGPGQKDSETATGSGNEGGNFGALVMTISALAVFLYFIQLILIPFVFAGALAYVLSPPVDAIALRTGVPRPAIAAAIFILVLALLAGIAFLAYPSISGEGTKFLTDLRGALTQAFNGITKGGSIRIFGIAYTASELADQSQNLLREAIGRPGALGAIAGAGVSMVFGFFLGAVLLFYFLLGGRRTVSGLVELAPPRRRPLVWEILRRADPILRRYFIGVGIIVTYAGIAAYIGLGLILGIKHAVILAIVTGFLELLPVAGPALAAILAGLIALQNATSIWDVAAYIIYAVALRLSIDQLFGPLILGKAASLSPVTIIFCFLTGGILYGISGVILAVPAALALRVSLKTIYGEFEEER
jgi:predicted PurR-regulated permease PerM